MYHVAVEIDPRSTPAEYRRVSSAPTASAIAAIVHDLHREASPYRDHAVRITDDDHNRYELEVVYGGTWVLRALP